MTLPRQTLRSTAYDLADALDVNELYQQKGWTDGLPIVPPTEERIVECLQAVGLAATDIVGGERIRQRPITAEKVAINAVMAGCLPAYMPVVAAILRATDDIFESHIKKAKEGSYQHAKFLFDFAGLPSAQTQSAPEQESLASILLKKLELDDAGSR